VLFGEWIEWYKTPGMETTAREIPFFEDFFTFPCSLNCSAIHICLNITLWCPLNFSTNQICLNTLTNNKQTDSLLLHIFELIPSFYSPFPLWYFNITSLSKSLQRGYRFCCSFPHTVVHSKQVAVMVSHSQLLFVLALTFLPYSIWL